MSSDPETKKEGEKERKKRVCGQNHWEYFVEIQGN